MTANRSARRRRPATRASSTDLARQLAEVSSRLAESRQRERALDSSRRELIAWVSHDLRSPLATIRAVAEALDDGIVDDATTVARYHHQIRQDAERLTVLVDDLFELSRINSGAVGRDRQEVRLRELVGDVIVEARPRAEVKGVELVDRMSELPTIPVSSQELRRALHNLIDNAIRHTPPGGTVVIETLADDEGALLSVVDECGGIPESDLTRVFDVAFRGDQARAKDDRGGGLGLAIAKGLVEAHQGSIEVANQSPGCRFTVRLPMASPRPTGRGRERAARRSKPPPVATDLDLPAVPRSSAPAPVEAPTRPHRTLGWRRSLGRRRRRWPPGWRSWPWVAGGACACWPTVGAWSCPQPPLLGRSGPGLTPRLAVPVLVAVVLVAALPWACRRLRWGVLLVASVAGSAVWAVGLAFVDGPSWNAGLTRGLTGGNELGADVARVAAHPARFLATFSRDIGQYHVQVRGHPPGMILVLVALRGPGAVGPGLGRGAVHGSRLRGRRRRVGGGPAGRR